MKRILILLLLAGCAETGSVGSKDHVSHDSTFVRQAVQHRVDFPHTVRQVGLMYDTDSPLTYRTGGTWKTVPVTWSEGRAHVGVIRLDGDETFIEFRADQAFRNATISLSEERTAPEPVSEPSEHRAYSQPLAPSDLVISRAEWGARDPNKQCGQPHDPSRISIHHTVAPEDDGADPAARVRQMQAFHIDSRGWCDIGYHFIVSQSGKIYQGRSSEERTGAHVGGHNLNNVGVSLIGNFETAVPGETQLDAVKRIVHWIATTYEIAFNRDVIKGHQEWSGQSTACPGQHVIAAFDDIVEGASTVVTQPPVEPECPALSATGGVVDNESPCFSTLGDGVWNTVSDAGHEESLLWSQPSQDASASSQARWRINVGTPGEYTVEYHSTTEYATFRSARFGIVHSGAEENLTVDLSAGDDGWNTLGDYMFDDSTQWVSIYNSTALPVEGAPRVIADAIRVTPVEPLNPVEPGETNNGNPSTNNSNGSNNATNNGNNSNNGQSNNTNGGNTNGPDDFVTNDGCATATPFPSLLWVLVLGFFRRRNSTSSNARS